MNEETFIKAHFTENTDTVKKQNTTMIKKILFTILFLFCLKGIMISQTYTVSSIPYKLHLENKASGVEVKTGKLRVIAPAHTDLFVSPDGNYAISNSPRLLFRPDSDFVFSSAICPAFKSNWDAGVLLLYNDSTHFAKFCFEKDYRGQARVVAVVCNDVADDCNSIAINDSTVYFRITGSAKGNTFNFYYSENGMKWYLIRSFRLVKTDRLQLGFSAQSPAGKGCEVDFFDINLQQRKIKDFWAGD